MLYILFIAGFFLVIYGANFLVDGAASLAKKLKVSTLVIGLTVVAFGTSAPELVVTLLASLDGKSDIAFGNVVGSNILNILLILGAASLVFPLTVHKNTVWKEIPLALLSALLIFVLANDALIDGVVYVSETHYVGVLSQIDSIVLLSFFLVFLFYAFAAAKQSMLEEENNEIKDMHPARSVGYVLLGLTGLSLGGNWIVDGATDIAARMGISEKFIGLTVVSLGTSLPELVTTLVAARKKQSDIAIGNVVGSNIFNTFLILGAGALAHPIQASAGSQVDIMVNIAANVLLFGLLFVGRRHTIGKPEGIVFLLGYVVYTVYLISRG